jgi:curved DNA-binding protein CbpA
MLESQGSRPLDPYRTLQLHPRAPRQLIVEAYWHLVSRRKLRGEAGSVSDLNAAYGLLMDEARRAAYDAEHGLSGAQDHGQRQGDSAPDHYDRLRVDPDADGEIIALAHEVLARGSTGQARESLDEAHRTLGNAQLRAQYDSYLETRGGELAAVPVVVPPRAPVHADAVPPMFRREEARVSDAPGGQRPDASAARPARPVRETPPPSRHGILGRLGFGRSSGPVMRPTHGEPRRFASDQALDAAKDERLLTLHGEPLAEQEVEAISAPPGPGNNEGIAALEFIAGPFAGLRVGLGSDVVTIGSAVDADVVLTDPADRIAPEHARIWQHGEHFVFRQFEGARTVIGGQRLMTSMVILDEGDEIQIGPHRMTFTEAPAPQA